MKPRGDRARGRAPIVTGAIAALALAADAFEPLRDALQLDRAAVSAGEWWRVFTAHLVHYSGTHLAWDLGMLVGLAVVLEQRSRRRLLLLVGVSAAVVSGTILLFTSFDTYRGLSGIDAALFVAVALELIRAPKSGTTGWSWLGWAALLGFLLKVLAEAWNGAPLFAGEMAAGVRNAPVAHAAGALAALVVRLTEAHGQTLPVRSTPAVENP